MSERVIRNGGLEIATEAFGDLTHQSVLLVMGGGASMLWWPEAFCRRLAGHGRYVIRYDQRDTGLSTKFEAGDYAYTLDDLADDALRVLNEHEIPSAHVVGMSLGAIVGQLAALRNPSRVLSLSAISSSPFGVDTSHLPGSSRALQKHWAAGEEVSWSDRAQVIDYAIEESRLCAGIAYPFDEEEARSFLERDFNRAGGSSSLSNFRWEGGDQYRGRLHEMKVPVLVIHGTADPVCPIEHGEALAAAVTGAKLVRLDGGGYELHRSHWDTIIDAIVAHTSTA